MSERSRRRRRRRRGGGGSSDSSRRVERETPQGQPVAREQAASTRRRRRRGRRGQERGAASPKSSEDLVRALPRERPATLTAPPDGQTLEGLIGDLQSEYGVPQYPQEYRITVKVAEERDRSAAAHHDESNVTDGAGTPAGNGGGPRREKAPSMRTADETQGGREGPAREQAASGQSRRSRRRRRRGRGRGGSAGPAGSSGSSGVSGNAGRAPGAPPPPPPAD